MQSSNRRQVTMLRINGKNVYKNLSGQINNVDSERTIRIITMAFVLTYAYTSYEVVFHR